MSSASVSPDDFAVVRRGYRPDQVDSYTAALSQDRDAAWERAARLTVLAKEMEAEAERLREAVARLAPQTYEALGEGARQLFELGAQEAEAVREGGRQDALRITDEAEAEGRGALEVAQAYADEVRGEAEERARQRLLVAHAEADDLRIEARLEVKERRGEALAALREVRQRTEGVLAEREREYADRCVEMDHELAGGEAVLDARHGERVARAEAVLSEATRAIADAEESDARMQADAEARGAELIAEARVQEDRIIRDTERVLREHAEQWDTVQAHMDHVRNSLATLTGRAPTEAE
ncbi:coiled-coil domain-containing protein [Streptomyces acidicola]|uniref:cellulose-binding protein n=1 Tax=Streptomyces acidicola TaxID=2596892 RepID=UPI00380B48BC